MDTVTWGTFTPDFVDALARELAGRRVLETFAGNGYLASMLAERGVEITATSLFSGHDGHERGMHHPVLEMDASDAVRKLGDDHDVLLMSWPTATAGAVRATLLWGSDRDIVFIGEHTNYDLDHLGGCADDLFFELTEEVAVLGRYESRNELERAAVRRLDPVAVKAWQDAGRPPSMRIEEAPPLRF